LKTLTDVSTESDEAFTLLLLENNWEFWLETVARRRADMEEQGGGVDGRKVRCTWTKSPKWTAKSSYCAKMEGWDLEAIDRYNDIMELVIADRNSHGAEFDLFYRQHLKRLNDRWYDKLERRLARPQPSKRAKVIMPDTVGRDTTTDSIATPQSVPKTVQWDELQAPTPSTLGDASNSVRELSTASVPC